MVVTVQLTGTSATGAVSGTDSKGDTLHVASDISDSSGDRLVTLSGVAANGLAVNDQITVSFPTASSYRITADEVSGATSRGSAVRRQRNRQRVLVRRDRHDQPGRRVRIRDGRRRSAGRPSAGIRAGTSLTTYTLGSNALGRAYQIPIGTGSFTASGTASGTWLAEVVAFK